MTCLLWLVGAVLAVYTTLYVAVVAIGSRQGDARDHE